MLQRIDLRGRRNIPDGFLLRTPGKDNEVEDQVHQIVAEIRQRGDSALYDLTERFDGPRLDGLVLTNSEIEEAFASLAVDLREALFAAERSVRRFHDGKRRSDSELTNQGLRIRTLVKPVSSVGCYVPGGRASYPSTVLMTAVVARVAGVERITVCVPPNPDGTVSAVTLAATKVANVDAVHPVGGAQAIAAMAYGTESIQKVEVIVGPGNKYVSVAKRQVAGEVRVPSGFAGPSEVVVIADSSVPAQFAAVDLLAQAEHGPDGMICLVVWDAAVANEVDAALGEVVEESQRGMELAETLASGGYCLLVDDLHHATSVVDAIAPEHLQIMAEGAETIADDVQNAGAIFCGPWTPTAIGDYLAGPSHVLPTAGTARYAGALTVADFTKDVHVVVADQDSLRQIAPHIEALAMAEGLDLHAESIRIRDRNG